MDQTVAFGTALHVTGKDGTALEQTLRQYAGRDHRIEQVETRLEDVFIHMMGDAQDNMAVPAKEATKVTAEEATKRATGPKGDA